MPVEGIEVAVRSPVEEGIVLEVVLHSSLGSTLCKSCDGVRVSFVDVMCVR
jgi:hypothetical protein